IMQNEASSPLIEPIRKESRKESGPSLVKALVGKKECGIFALLIVLCAVTGFENPRFFSHENLVNTANLIGLFGIFSIGAGLVIITSGIDLSVGSMIALNGMLSVIALTEWHLPWPLAVLFALVVPMVLGVVHGVLIARFKMQPFIVTLC